MGLSVGFGIEVGLEGVGEVAAPVLASVGRIHTVTSVGVRGSCRPETSSESLTVFIKVKTPTLIVS